MSHRHEGVSCDACLKSNFRGRRYKCLTCYDYDLCASCYENGTVTNRHTTCHPMQCIITKSDFELYYKGEGLTSDQSQSYTCPFCGKMGFTEVTLQEHVNTDHSDSTAEVVCPVCAALPGGDPNLVIEDFSGHLALEHRPSTRDLITFLEEPTNARHNARRLPHSTRGIGSTRARRSNMHFSSAGISTLSPSGRDTTIDPIAELLSQLSGTRRNNSSQGSASAQLQQLQIQLQLERQQVRAARQQLERRRPTYTPMSVPMTSGATGAVSTLGNHILSVSGPGTGVTSATKSTENMVNSNSSLGQQHPQLMLTRCMDTVLSESDLELLETERADRSLFLQELLLSTLMNLSDTEGDDDENVPVSEIEVVPSDDQFSEIDSSHQPTTVSSHHSLSSPQTQNSSAAKSYSGNPKGIADDAAIFKAQQSANNICQSVSEPNQCSRRYDSEFDSTNLPDEQEQNRNDISNEYSLQATSDNSGNIYERRNEFSNDSTAGGARRKSPCPTSPEAALDAMVDPPTPH